MTVMGHLFPERTAKQHSESLARIRKFPLAPMTEDFYTLVTSYEIPTWLQGYEYGPEDGGKGTIMLNHGYAGRAMQFYALIPLLVARGYRVIGLDMSACGALLELSRIPVHPIALIGHSMGAVTNILFASFCRRSPYLDKLKCIANIGTQDSSVDNVKKINVPLLLIHDTQDKEVAVFNSRNIVAAAKEVVDERRSEGGTDNDFKNFEYRYVETEGLGH
ncbi:alpha/beta-hydrolase [Gonapodya prolifera JEL478]|uniref:Alpha/beta-hydrolase n=1 Tax=Gonapodya prolifera (strain JEL478) TaxID=1344416 RepID=A0A139A6P2_GONPJ|nr:alpha/beta-hydrolase [Gonapodya prolifera JEL478]|eukprot:KXS12329.1 alpha/beta-hydrolase [Gonapodya prolifera JEL478]